jgi:hypothetical protein
MDDQEILIFDTSPLIHFSREGPDARSRPDW